MGKHFCLYCCSDLIWICVSRADRCCRGFGKKMKSLFNVLKALKAAIIFLVQILTSDTAKRQRNGVGKCMSANWNTSKLGQRFQLDLGLTGFSKGSIYLTIKIALYCNGFFSFKIVTRWIALLFVLDPVCWPDSKLVLHLRSHLCVSCLVFGS